METPRRKEVARRRDDPIPAPDFLLHCSHFFPYPHFLS
jgi:hypothetical protein